MLKYIYIVAKKDKVPLRRALDRFLSELPFWPTDILVRKQDRSLLIAAEIAEAAAPGQRNLHIDRSGAFTAYEGLPLGAHLRARPDAWPSEIGARVRADRSRFFAETAGVFAERFGRSDDTIRRWEAGAVALIVSRFWREIAELDEVQRRRRELANAKVQL